MMEYINNLSREELETQLDHNRDLAYKLIMNGYSDEVANVFIDRCEKIIGLLSNYKDEKSDNLPNGETSWIEGGP